MAKRSNKTLVLSLIAEADVVANEHEVYHEQFVTRANETLYKLLANMLRVCLDIEASGESERVIKQMRNQLLTNYGLKTQANSRTSAIVVRYIVRSGRKTAHVYGRVIEVAIENNITPEQLPDFIRDKGGIEEIRLSVVSAEEKKLGERKWENARNAMASLLYKRGPIGKVAFNSNARLPVVSDVEFSYLICQNNIKTGEIDVLGTLYPSSDIEARALDLFSYVALVMQHNGTSKLYDMCKEYGFNQDVLHNWMKLNGFSDDAVAKDFAKSLISTTDELNKKGE